MLNKKELIFAISLIYFCPSKIINLLYKKISLPINFKNNFITVNSQFTNIEYIFYYLLCKYKFKSPKLIYHEHGFYNKLKRYNSYSSISNVLCKTNIYFSHNTNKKNTDLKNLNILYLCCTVPNLYLETYDWGPFHKNLVTKQRKKLNKISSRKIIDNLLIRPHPRQNSFYGELKSNYISKKFKRTNSLHLSQDLKNAKLVILEDFFTASVYEILSNKKIFIIYINKNYFSQLYEKGIKLFKNLNINNFLCYNETDLQVSIEYFCSLSHSDYKKKFNELILTLSKTNKQFVNYLISL